LKFIVDAQLPPALARTLTALGHEAEHVHDFGGDGVPDGSIWQRAQQHGAVILTKDEDFLLRHQSRVQGPPVIWIRWGNTRKQPLLEKFGTLLPAILAALDRGETLVELI
jgi:predicted nuclease of predicted toxin-antitoxin system